MTTAQPGQEQRMELKACPLCGGTASVRQHPTFAATIEKHIGCTSCGLTLPAAHTQGARIADWNTRPTADLGDDGEMDAALLRARTNIQQGGNTLRIDSADLQLFVRVLSRSGG